MMQKNGIIKYAYIVGMCLLLFLTGGCSHKVGADISAYETMEIAVSGISENTVTMTPKELKQLKCVNKTVKSKSGKRTVTVKAAGPTLETFLQHYKIEQKQLERVIVVAGDGYTKEFDSDFFLIHPEMILAVANGRNALDEDEQPVRLVIPGTTPDFWVRNVASIRIERKGDT